MTNIDAFKKTLIGLYTVLIAKEYGRVGTEGLRAIVDKVVEIYKYLDPENFSGEIFLVKSLGDHDIFNIELAEEIINIESISSLLSGEIFFQIYDSGRIFLWRNVSFNPNEQSDGVIVYQYTSRFERFYANGKYEDVLRYNVEQSSVFAIAAFRSLHSAIDAYKIKVALHSNCGHLKQVWGDENRIVFRNTPEKILRDSLTQFLHAHLRGNVEVRAEQNVDESHPIDIKITWQDSNRRALIEIKWLGKSLNTEGIVSTTYTDSRARDGAQQLADYLDVNKIRSTTHITRGYLVVFDARRGKIRQDGEISSQEPHSFRDSEINFETRYELQRNDFEKPIRIYMETNYGRFQ